MKPKPPIESLILTIRGERVILAADFSDLKSQNMISRDGSAALRSQFVTLDTPLLRSQNATLKPGRHAKYPPYAFTEHGAIMAANVLNSPEAVAMGVYVVRAFVRM